MARGAACAKRHRSRHPKQHGHATISKNTLVTVALSLGNICMKNGTSNLDSGQRNRGGVYLGAGHCLPHSAQSWFMCMFAPQAELHASR